MNFSQLQERLRLELRRRIERGTLSVSLLARQTGLGQAHVSNFLSARRGLSLRTLDKILAAQHLSATDFLPFSRNAAKSEPLGERVEVPLVTHSTALFEPYLRPSNTQRVISLPADLFKDLRPRCTPARRQWERFISFQLEPAHTEDMEPALRPGALIVVDRHYSSLAAYRPGEANLYAARSSAGRLVFRYAHFQADRLILQTSRPGNNVEVIELTDNEAPGDFLAGRIAMILHEL